MVSQDPAGFEPTLQLLTERESKVLPSALPCWVLLGQYWTGISYILLYNLMICIKVFFFMICKKSNASKSSHIFLFSAVTHKCISILIFFSITPVSRPAGQSQYIESFQLNIRNMALCLCIMNNIPNRCRIRNSFLLFLPFRVPSNIFQIYSKKWGPYYKPSKNVLF